MIQKYKDLKNVLNKGSSFLLIAHLEPDGDAIGAALSLAKFIDKLGKRVDVAMKDPVPHFFSFLTEGKKINRDFLIGDYDAIILIDNGDLKRTGFADRINRAKDKGIKIVNIDHHLQNDIWKIADINIADPGFSSTSEIIYDLLEYFEFEIDPEVATNLLAGIFYDTGGFQHSNTTNKVLNIVSELLRRGARLKRISKNVGQAKSVRMLKLWGIALNRIKVIEKYGIAISVITKADIKETGATEEEISGLINLINSTAEADASLLIYESENDTIKGSLRTESDKIDVSRLAKALGGGGHKKASGFSLSGKIEKTNGSFRIK